jgi:benzoate-CoA ligase
VINHYRPTLFFAVPTAYAAMLHAAERGMEVDMSSVRLCVSAGESLPASLYQRWLERFGVEILDGIGSTEVLHIFLTNRPGEVRPGSTGKAVPGYELKLVDDAGAPVPQGEIGNLMVKGDSTCAYYWNKHQNTRRTMQGEWIRTGDKYSVDADGYYWYAGRSDDMWLEGGQWVSPVDVEEVLAADSAVRDAAVTRVAGAQPYVLACLVLDDTGDAAGDDTVERLGALVADKLGPSRRPDRIAIVAALPRTASGKVQRHRLPDLVDDGGRR